MTDLLDHAVTIVRNLAPDAQDDLARMILHIVGKHQPLIQLTVEEEASLEESLAEAERGEFATDEQVRATWANHGL